MRAITSRALVAFMARGRDATDVAISTSCGTTTVAGFEVVTEEVV
jgi:hypothetical protein